ncbi:MAG: hypothetical protein LBE36_06380 [Flavobacteriaceae bacterium]|jgi:hypothetical protein|nr:hypothetical protein [Flavobacteriaceae bacterium]
MDMVKYTKDNAFLRIKAWYIDEDSVQLSGDDIRKKDRMVHIWGLRINNKYSRHQVIQIVMRDHKISQATAYRDYMLSQQLFGDIDNVNIAAERMVLAESYWNLYQMSLKKGNEETARKCLDSYKSLYNFLDTSQKIDPKKLEASNYILRLPRNTNKLISKMLSAGVVDFNSLDAEDVEFKEVTDNQEDDEDVS